MNAPLQTVIEALKNSGCDPKPGSDGNYSCRCPAHDDTKASCSIKEGNDGRVVALCFAGCKFEAIVEALGLRPADFYPDPRVEYDYTDENGDILFQVVRRPGKKFFQRRLDNNGGWINGRGDAPDVLYNLPDVLAVVGAQGIVYLGEGEKDSDRINDTDPESLKFVGTTLPGGAGKKPTSESLAVLADANVVIIADRDDAGRAYARNLRDALRGVAASVRVVEAAEGKDAYDHIEAGYGLDDFKPLDLEAEENERLGLVDLSAVAKAATGEIEWLIVDFILRSALVLLAGRWKSGKTMVVVAAILQALAGRDVFGVFPVARDDLRVMFWQFEMPVDAILRRIRKLCIGLRIDPKLLVKWQREGRLVFLAQPELNLTNPSHLSVFHRQVKRFDPHLIVIDSAGEAGYSISENELVRSQLKVSMNPLLRAGRSVIMLTHKRKGQPNGKPDDAGDSIIGAQSWAAKASRIYTLDQVGDERGPGDFDVRLRSLRGWDLTQRADVCLRIRDEQIDGEWGTVIESIDEDEARRAGLVGKLDQAKARLREEIQRDQYRYGELIDRLVQNYGITNRTAKRAYSELVNAGRIDTENGVVRWKKPKF